MEGQSGLSELSVISWVSTFQGCPLSGVPVYCFILRNYTYIVNRDVFPIMQTVSTCNLTGSLLLGLQVDDSLTEPIPLLSLEIPGRLVCMANSWHLNSAKHYLFLGANGGRLFQVNIYN